MTMGAREDTCCFTGHRPEKLPWGDQEDDPRCIKLKTRLRDAVESAYETGMRHFICGMARGCDLYFCEEVLHLREKHGDILLEAAIPCLSQADAWSAPERERYRRLVALCDVETVVQQQYTPSCMQRRNRYMVDHASLLIAVHDGLPGGTMQTILYGMKRGLTIVDIPPVLVERKPPTAP